MTLAFFVEAVEKKELICSGGFRSLKKYWYCGAKGRFITREYVDKHHCLCRQKGRIKGKRCKFLVCEFKKDVNR